ncbi:ATP-grasp domain protein [Methyloversatilis sp. RAC08]|uniref:ATP-grasp domain-containing protein n=1 Tax=Methyloversatilis sp. RAC08 TaxID=1842540 RepID=UPI00083D7BD3|nr:ATP-grasp domain-containing protein [Methyloversatilis sp. RAC08]AOF82329.1 ATP-grasp domain protein [Methyloversatilis sp. RAC08]
MPHWLIVSGSARALAQSCVAAGWTCDVIDPFADTDTQAVARRTVRADFRDGAFGDELPALIAGMAGRWDGIVDGSGFEPRPDLLSALDRAFHASAPRRGNAAATVQQCKTPDALAAGLREAGVRHAAMRSEGRAPDGWLMKQTGACGGAHVRPAQGGETIPTGWHAQACVAGIPASVLFLADGHRGRIVGVSRQFPGAIAGPYAWCEAVSDLPLDDAQLALLERDVDAIVRAFGLRGLNGADLVLEGGRHVLLEINPRPTATLALYDGRVAGGLFAAHIAACAGQLADVAMSPARALRGLRVVYAPHDLIVGNGVRWPEGCTDLPAAGSFVAKAAPVCTAHAAGQDETRVRAQLQRRETEVLHLIAPFAGAVATHHNNELEFPRRSA